MTRSHSNICRSVGALCLNTNLFMADASNPAESRYSIFSRRSHGGAHDFKLALL